MRKLKTYLLVVLSPLIFTACGSGGGSDSATSQVPSIGGGTNGGDSGGTTGGNANATYYGIATDSSAPITNQPVLPTNGSLMSIPNEFAVNIRNLNTRTMDVFIYQPTCVVGLLTEEYSIVLISGSQSAPTILRCQELEEHQGPECTAQNFSFTNPYDSASFQISGIPLIYIQGEYDSSVPISQASYHYLHQSSNNKYFVVAKDGGHSTAATVADCKDSFWNSVFNEAADFEQSIKNCVGLELRNPKEPF